MKSLGQGLKKLPNSLQELSIDLKRNNLGQNEEDIK